MAETGTNSYSDYKVLELWLLDRQVFHIWFGQKEEENFD